MVGIVGNCTKTNKQSTSRLWKLKKRVGRSPKEDARRGNPPQYLAHLFEKDKLET
jgi:hypothetical protein